MEITVSRSLRLWWIFVIRGVLFALVGIYLFAYPLSGYLTLGFSFGLIIFLTGIAELLRAYQGRGEGNRGWHLFTGIIDIILGIILMSHLAASLIILRIIMGFYFLFKGITLLTFRRHTQNQWWLLIGGLIVLLFVGLIWFNPAFGAMTIIVWTGMAFLVTGILNIMLGLRLKPRSL